MMYNVYEVGLPEHARHKYLLHLDGTTASNRLYYTMLCYAMLYCTVLYCTMLHCYSIVHYIMVYYIISYNNMNDDTKIISNYAQSTY